MCIRDSRIIDRDAVVSPAADELADRFSLTAVHVAPMLAGPEDLTRRIVGRLGALRSGAVKTLVTDVATAEAVVALDDGSPA